MKVIIIGCGAVGVVLAQRLILRQADVAIIDNVRAAFNNLPTDFDGLTIEGDALNQGRFNPGRDRKSRCAGSSDQL